MLRSLIASAKLGGQLLSASTLRQSYLERSFRMTTPCGFTVQSTGGQVEAAIRRKLQENLEPVHLEIINESSKHGVPPGSESHFKVVIVSDRFSNLAILQRHRLVNDTLSDELKTSIHALSIVAKTPEQWNSSQSVPKSPPCLGGSKAD